jgi:hypothetical protein
VSYLVGQPFELEGLFHDGHEFVLGDVSTPVKSEMSPRRYKALARKWDLAIAERFELSTGGVAHTLIKVADRLCQFHEARLLVGVRKEETREFGRDNPKYGETWGDDPGKLVDRLPSNWGAMLEPLPPELAENAFLKRYDELRRARPFTFLASPKGDE